MFGDDVVVNLKVISVPLPQPQLSCEDTISYVSSQNQFGPAYCSTTSFRRVCCETCKSNKKDRLLKKTKICHNKNNAINIHQEYDALICADTQANCPQWISFCNSGANIGGINVNILCPKTCGQCQSNKTKIVLSSI